jgi:hypothetical protein
MTNPLGTSPPECRGQRKARFEARAIASLVLTALGLSSVVGVCIGSPLLSAAGRILLFAPQPRVFDDENISAEVKLEIHLPSGLRPIFRLDRATRRRIVGPLHRVDGYGHALLGARVVSARMRVQVLRFGLCNGGPLVRELDLPEGAVKYWIYMSYRSRPSVRTDILPLACDAAVAG